MRCCIFILALLCATSVVHAKKAKSKPETRPEPPRKADDLFGLTNVWTVHLHVSAEDWRTMQPNRSQPGKSRLQDFFDAFRAPTTRPSTRPTTRPLAPPRPTPIRPARTNPNSFGIAYTYVPATVEIEGQVMKDVGLRFKGNVSYTFAEKTPRRPFKIDFERYVDGQRFCGLGTINLHNDSFDDSHMREAMAYYVFRKAGVPAPRTAYALVYLTVDGQYDNEYLGLYTITEELDRKFLRKHFGSDNGLLLKPEGGRGGPSLMFGEKWQPYERILRPRTAPTTQRTDRYMEFARLVQKASDEEFRRRFAEFVDVDEFLRFLAGNVLICNLDSFLLTDHNFYVYVNEDDGLVRWMPWDLHLSWGSYGPGQGSKQAELSIDRAFFAPQKLLERVFADPQLKQQYHQRMREIIQDGFSPAHVAKKVKEIEKKVLTRADEAARAAGKYGNSTTRPAATQWARSRIDLITFATSRVHSVANQLQGASNGVDIQSLWQQRAQPRPAPRPTTRPATRPVATPVTRPSRQFVPPPQPKSRAEIWRDSLWPTTRPARPAQPFRQVARPTTRAITSAVRPTTRPSSN